MKKILACSALLMSSSSLLADGSSIGKVYYPYVQPLEKEFEYLLIADEDPQSGVHRRMHSIGFGTAVHDDWFIESAVQYVDQPESELESVELEVRHQLTEQGEYDSDWGIMLELEKEHAEDGWEFGAGLLNSREWQRWQFTSNFFVLHEWGDDVEDETETSLSAQAKYRYSQNLEPAIEVFISEDTRALGPVLSGLIKTHSGSKFFWEAGVILGTWDRTADVSWKFSLEYEFF